MYVIGTRPEAIRSARMLRIMDADPQVDLALLNTGQHYDANMMSDFLNELEVPKATFDLTVGSAEPAIQTAAIIDGVGEILGRESFDAVCVFGDTNSTLGAALAAVKTNIPLVHIEAGGRSFDMCMPEEINRRLVDHISGLLLCVAEFPKKMLLKENVMGRIEVVGDPQFDVFTAHAPRPGTVAKRNEGLVTIHREENADNEHRLRFILDELSTVSKERGIEWIFPVHPRIASRLPSEQDGVNFVEPFGYRELLEQLSASLICVTDSGGLQKEALWSHVPCVTARDRSEWVELVEQGANALAPADAPMAAIITKQMDAAESMDFSNPYGEGDCSLRTTQAIKNWIQSGNVNNWREEKLAL